MRTFARLLRDGLRLSVLRRPRNTPLDAGFGTWLALAALGLALDAAWQWFLVPAPRILNGFGLQTALASGLTRLAASAALCALTQRRALFWTAAGWLEAAALLPTLFGGGLFVASMHSRMPLQWIGWWLAMVWSLLILLRLALFLQAARPQRAFAGAALAFALQVGPWLWLDPQWLWMTDWASTTNDADESVEVEPGTLSSPEATFYAQSDLLSDALAKLQPQRPDRIDLYALAFGGDASEDVFRNEVEYVEQLMPRRFDAAGHTLALLNHAETSATRPLATATNLERALAGLGERMDTKQDVLFVYLTSHGSKTHEIYVNQPPLPLDQLTPERLRAALDASGIRWRVLVISACYSGGYVDALRDARTLVITAARADRASFGCGAESEITWFGKAYLAEALNETVDFAQAFALSKRRIAEWERDEEVEASHPQIAVGAKIGAQLQRWRAGFEPGPALPFVPADRDPDVKRKRT